MRDLDNFHSLQERAWQIEKELESRSGTDSESQNKLTDKIFSLASFLFSDRCKLHSYKQEIEKHIKEYKNLTDGCKYCIYSESIDCFDPKQTESWAGRDPSECTIYTVEKSISTLYRMKGLELECLRYKNTNCLISLIRDRISFLDRLLENFSSIEKGLKDINPVINEDKYWSSPAGCSGFKLESYKGEVKNALIKALDTIKEAEG